MVEVDPTAFRRLPQVSVGFRRLPWPEQRGKPKASVSVFRCFGEGVSPAGGKCWRAEAFQNPGASSIVHPRLPEIT
jgi:hypothetical protein